MKNENCFFFSISLVYVCEQNRKKLRVCQHQLRESLKEKLHFCLTLIKPMTILKSYVLEVFS